MHGTGGNDGTGGSTQPRKSNAFGFTGRVLAHVALPSLCVPCASPRPLRPTLLPRAFTAEYAEDCARLSPSAADSMGATAIARAKAAAAACEPLSGHAAKTSRRRLRGRPKLKSPCDTSTRSARRNGSTIPSDSPRYARSLWCSRIIVPTSGIHPARPALIKYCVDAPTDGSRQFAYDQSPLGRAARGSENRIMCERRQS
jgi:hypothetical protein